ncbi:MAG: hypothetical protein EP346_07060 [Bacteroidetes bacterium]|nr:MAG: hypothetical protein EP346_07060 [Bacteroidota bacterium]
MSNLPLDPKDLETWALKYNSKAEFLLLLARLIKENTERSTKVRFPFGSGVALAGFDGEVHSPSAVGVIPEGLSLWEVGVNGGKSKAEDDYKKRSEAEIDGLEKREAVFIFVTTKSWEGGKDWAEAKTKEGKWKEVVVLDAQDLSLLIADSPVSLRRFKDLSRSSFSDSIYTAEDYWRQLASTPLSELSPKVILAGRESEAFRLQEYLNGDPEMIYVVGESIDDATLFIISVGMMQDEDLRELFYSRTLFIERDDKFQQMRKNLNSMNLVALFDRRDKIYVGVMDGHHVLAPVGPDDDIKYANVINLPPINKDKAIIGIQEMGFSRIQAEELLDKSDNSVSILKRNLGYLRKAKWKTEENLVFLTYCFLIGKWDRQSVGDRSLIEKISGLPYSEFEGRVFELLKEDASPLLIVGEQIRVTSPFDLWINTAGLIKRKHLLSFKRALKKVLFSGVDQNGEKYSSWIQDGLLQSATLIALNKGNECSIKQETQSYIDEFFVDVLGQFGFDDWKAKARILPQIAEASPNAFLYTIEKLLSEGQIIHQLFNEVKGMLYPLSHHTGLLWALEALAQQREYFQQSFSILVRLDEIDPGGKLANRPLASLKDILLPWHLQTNASFEERMSTLEKSLKGSPQTVKNLIISLLPLNNGISNEIYGFKWRSHFSPKPRELDVEELHRDYKALVYLLVSEFDHTDLDVVRLIKVLKAKRLPLKVKSVALEALESSGGQFTSSTHLITELASVIEMFEMYTNLNEEATNYLDRLYGLFNYFFDNSVSSRLAYLFSSDRLYLPKRIFRIETLGDSHVEKVPQEANFILGRDFELLTEFRIHEISVIAIEDDVISYDKVIEEKIEFESFGYHLGEFRLKEGLFDHIAICDTLSSPHSLVFKGYVRRRFELDGIDELRKMLGGKECGLEWLVSLFVGLRQTKDLWDYISEFGSDVKALYWSEMRPWFWVLEPQELKYGLTELRSKGRIVSALDVIYHKPEKVESSLIVDLLHQLYVSNTDKMRIDHYSIGKLIEVLYKRDDVADDIIVNLEWDNAHVLTYPGSAFKPKRIYQKMASDYQYFVEIIKKGYRPQGNDKKHEESGPSKEESLRAFALLQDYDSLPMNSEDSGLQWDFVMEWIKNARKLARKVDRLSVADVYIGKFLAQSQEESEGLWPAEPVAQIIDEINSRSMKNGFSTGAFNKRGSSVRGVYDGGEIERRHMEFFLNNARAYKKDYPITSEVLENLALQFKNMALEQDISAQLDKLDS